VPALKGQVDTTNIINQLNWQLSMAKEMKAVKTANHEVLKQVIRETEEDIAELKKNLAQKSQFQEKRKELEKELAKLNQEIKTLQHRLKVLQEKNQQLKKEIALQKLKIIKLQEEDKLLTDTLYQEMIQHQILKAFSKIQINDFKSDIEVTKETFQLTIKLRLAYNWTRLHELLHDSTSFLFLTFGSPSYSIDQHDTFQLFPNISNCSDNIGLQFQENETTLDSTLIEFCFQSDKLNKFKRKLKTKQFYLPFYISLIYKNHPAKGLPPNMSLDLTPDMLLIYKDYPDNESYRQVILYRRAIQLYWKKKELNYKILRSRRPPKRISF